VLMAPKYVNPALANIVIGFILYIVTPLLISYSLT